MNLIFQFKKIRLYLSLLASSSRLREQEGGGCRDLPGGGQAAQLHGPPPRQSQGGGHGGPDPGGVSIMGKQGGGSSI